MIQLDSSGSESDQDGGFFNSCGNTTHSVFTGLHPSSLASRTTAASQVPAVSSVASNTSNAFDMRTLSMQVSREPLFFLFSCLKCYVSCIHAICISPVHIYRNFGFSEEGSENYAREDFATSAKHERFSHRLSIGSWPEFVS